MKSGDEWSKGVMYGVLHIKVGDMQQYKSLQILTSKGVVTAGDFVMKELIGSKMSESKPWSEPIA